MAKTRKFENQLPSLLKDELELARKLGIHPSKIGTAEFDAAINLGTVKWAVSEAGELPVIPKFVDGQEVAHTVLTAGQPVQTAGEAEIVGGAGHYVMLEINNRSGHYQPTADSLDIGKQVFQAHGIEPPP